MKTATWVSFALGLCAAGCFADSPEKPAPEHALHELDLRTMPPELAPPSLLGDARPSLRDVVSDIRKLAVDPHSEGLFLRLGNLGGAWAVQQDVAQALEDYRSTDKPVHCHAEGLDNAAFALAARGCDRLSMTPAGTLDLVGLAMQLLHARELLSTIGVKAELLQVGKYKGAAEPFTRDQMSPEFAQSLNALLDDLDGQFRRAIEGRGKGGDPVASGPYGARDALDAGLIDAVEYDDAARKEAMTAAGAEDRVRLHAPPKAESLDLGTLWKALTSNPEERRDRGTRMAYVVLGGEILDGDTPALDRVISEPTIRALRRLADDDDVKSVVVRIDSPGGSALASDRIWHALRRVAARKPVAVSVGNMAASGGYYIASAANRIFASPASLVGSIGVVGGKVTVQELAERHGVHADTLQRGAHATWMSPLTPFTDAERGQLEQLLQRTYRLFLHRVGVGRGIPVSELHGFTQGRLMTGRRALEGKLVDALGGLSDAFTWAREEAKLPDDVRVETWPGEGEAMAALAGLLSNVQAPVDVAGLSRVVMRAAPGPVPAWTRSLADGPRAVTALPWSVLVR